MNEQAFHLLFDTVIEKINNKKQQTSTLKFPIIIWFNQVEEELVMQIKFSVTDNVSGSEIRVFRDTHNEIQSIVRTDDTVK